MRGLRDILLVATVGVATLTLGVIGVGVSRMAPVPLTVDSFALTSVPWRIGEGAIERDRPERAWSPARAAFGATQRLASRPGTPPGLRRERPLGLAASPEANDLRSFLNDMARATRDGNAIGIYGPDASRNWVDDEAKGDH